MYQSYIEEIAQHALAKNPPDAWQFIVKKVQANVEDTIPVEKRYAAVALFLWISSSGCSSARN